jgi:hypothetical protein
LGFGAVSVAAQRIEKDKKLKKKIGRLVRQINQSRMKTPISFCELCSNRPEIAIPAQKINLDDTTRFG